jgi:hypothetical protein
VGDQDEAPISLMAKKTPRTTGDRSQTADSTTSGPTSIRPPVPSVTEKRLPSHSTLGDTHPEAGQAHFSIQRAIERSKNGIFGIDPDDRTELHVYQDISDLDVANTIKKEKANDHWVIRANTELLSEAGKEVRKTCDDFAQWLTSVKYKEESFEEIRDDKDLAVGDVVNVSVAGQVKESSDLRRQFYEQKKQQAKTKTEPGTFGPKVRYEHPAGEKFEHTLQPDWVSYHYTTVVAKAGKTIVTCEVNREYQEKLTTNPWFNIYENSQDLTTKLRNTYSLKKKQANLESGVWKGVVKKASTR